MALQPRRSPAEGDFLFEIDPEPLEESVTAWGGVPLLVRALRSLDVPGQVKRNLRLKQRRRGYDEATYVESFVVLNALGGDCLEDFERLKEDEGLAEMLGHEIPSPEAARKFLYQFHEEANIEQAQQELALGQVSYIPAESAPLRGLAQVNRAVVGEVGWRSPDQKIATIDLDATVIESWKREAKPTYEGSRGYQPLLALWAELLRARPKRLRFLILQTPAKLAHHARRVRLRLKRAREQIRRWVEALAWLPAPAEREKTRH